MLEAALKTWFNFQRFEREPALQAVIDEALDRFGAGGILSLEDDDLALAAGGAGRMEEPRESADDGRGTV